MPAQKRKTKFRQSDRVIFRSSANAREDMIGKIVNVTISQRTGKITYLLFIEAIGCKIIKYQLQATEFDPAYQGETEPALIWTTAEEDELMLFSQPMDT